MTSLQGPVGHGLGEKLSCFREEREHFEFVEKTLRGFKVHEDPDTVGEFVKRIHSKCKLHACFGAELVYQYLRTRVLLHILKEQRRTARFSTFRLAHTVCDFGDFQNRVNFGLDALQFAGAVESRDPLAEIIERQRLSPRNC